MTEPDFGMVECFLPNNRCVLTPPCKLPQVINEALARFIEVFDAYSLEDIRMHPKAFEAGRFDPIAAEQRSRGPALPPAPLGGRHE